MDGHHRSSPVRDGEPLTAAPHCATTADGSQPMVAVVLPLFRHSVLVSEAIASVMAQRTKFEFRLVVVNDGCPHAESDETLRHYALAYPDRIVYLHKRNNGLSAARNTGIDFALSAWPSVRAIYLLDADNRLFPFALQRAWETLHADPQIGWAYPDMDMFGIENNAGASGPYSVLKHLGENYCEAGSLVRREIFDKGLRFDESMKLGFEDWDFWLQAVEAGYVGAHVDCMGFRYRKRPESMLSNSERDRAEIIAYMHRKHKALFHRNEIALLEHREAPRYAIHLGDTNEVIFATDPRLASQRMPWSEFTPRFLGAWADPQGTYSPNFLVYTTKTFLATLGELRLVNWCFWRLEEALNGDPAFATVTLEANGNAPDLVRLRTSTAEEMSDLPQRSGLVMVSRRIFQECVADKTTDWIVSLAGSQPLPPVFKLKIEADCEAAVGECRTTGVSVMLRSLFEFRDVGGDAGNRLAPEWRARESRSRSDLHLVSRELLKVWTVYPRVRSQPEERNVGFLLPLVSIGGVEKVAVNLARAVGKLGWRPHLFVFAATEAQGLGYLTEAFETINFLDDGLAGRYDPAVRYFGTGFSTWVRDGDHRRAIGLLTAMDAVINCHSVDAHAIIGSLRRLGIATLCHLHLVDHDAYGAPTGIPYQAIAYEHSYQGILVISEKLKAWCHAMGVPADKLVMATNAPSYPLSPWVIERLLAERRERQGGKLRVAFIGRLDRQKGLDRLTALVHMAERLALPVEWRVVGGTVLAEDAARLDVAALEPYRHPPALTPAALNSHLSWADVLVLPSYFEGVPLTVLEAMRVGVVPLVTRVGAVHEIVADGDTGLIVDNGPRHAVVDAMLDRLRGLCDDRALLLRLAERAAQAASAYDWDATARVVVERLDKLVDKRTTPLPYATGDTTGAPVSTLS
jgi:glycosyltransferase involved in cell wall biosynthesis